MPLNWTAADADYCAARVMEWADALARHSDDADGLTCTYLSPAHRATATLLAGWMREAGFVVREDALGNVIGRYAGTEAARIGCVATGSHYDTVRNGGRYDGRLGILLPLAIVDRLNARGERFACDLELVAFSEEEGVRFGSSFLGSSAYAGHFDPDLLAVTDSNGASIGEVLTSAGFDLAAIPSAAVDPRDVRQFFEVHIEQGPVLLDRGLALGVVQAIAGGVRRRVNITGLASHAGTTPMDMRHDAACAAAELTLFVERRCSGVPGLVGTVGMLDVPQGSINVIPGRCVMSLDVRSGNDAERDAALADIDGEIARIAQARGVQFAQEELMRKPAQACDATAQSRWSQALSKVGVAPLGLPSGAGHDAMMVARAMPVSMLFVRCGNGGISHHPSEIVDAADVALAASATVAFIASTAAA